MTTQEFMDKLNQAEKLIQEVESIFGEIDMAFDRPGVSTETVEYLYNDLLAMFPDGTGYCKSASEVFDAYFKLLENSDEDEEI